MTTQAAAPTTPAAPAQAAKSGALNPAQAGSKIAELLKPKVDAQPKQEAAEQPKKPIQKQAQKKPPAEVVQDQAADEQDGQDEAVQGDILSDDAAEPTDEQSQEDQAVDESGDEVDTDEGDILDDGLEETMHTVKVDGKELQVSYSELIEGYQRAVDYTRKTQEVAKQRKEVEAMREQVKELPQVQKMYEDNAKRFDENARIALVALEQRFMPKHPDAALRESNPAEYIKQKELYQDAMQFRHALQQEHQLLGEQLKAEARKQVQEGRKKLYEIYPEMQDAAVRQRVREYAHNHGFTDENIMSEPNPVLFVWADKARKYDEMVAKQKSLTSDAPKPKVVKQDKAVKNHKALQARKRAEPIMNHRKEKSVGSAGRAIESVLGLGKRS